MIEYEFTIHGRPRGKGRPKFTKDGHAYTDEKTREYERIVRNVFRKKYGMDAIIPKGYYITVEIIANFKVPDSDSKSRKAAKRTGMIPADIKPDVDNITKIILDSLNGEAWGDDSEVNDQHTQKQYSARGNCVDVKIVALDVRAGEPYWSEKYHET